MSTPFQISTDLRDAHAAANVPTAQEVKALLAEFNRKLAEAAAMKRAGAGPDLQDAAERAADAAERQLNEALRARSIAGLKDTEGNPASMAREARKQAEQMVEQHVARHAELARVRQAEARQSGRIPDTQRSN